MQKSNPSLGAFDDEAASRSAAAPAPAEAPLTRRRLREQEAQAASLSGRRAARAAGTGATTSAPRTRERMPRAARSSRVGGAPRRARSRVAAEVTAVAVPVGVRAAGIRRRLLSNFITASAMAGVGLILVATTVPANAFSRPEAPGEGGTAKSSQVVEAQEFTGDAVAAPTVTRDSFTAVSLQAQVAARGGNKLFDYTNNPNGTIQWPFPSGAPITSGFGGRHVAGCGFCSTYHKGMDFTPGTGTPIHSIADGVVSLVQSSRGGLGIHVIVEHVINGQKVQSVYAHMLSGSVEVSEGQTVTVGQVLGGVGSTGASTGAHLHLEIHLDGTPVDPYAWLKANAN